MGENDNKVEAKESKSLLEESPNFSRVEGSIEPKADTYIKTAEVETQKEKDDDKIEDKTINESKTEAQKEKDNASQKVSENDNKTELKEHRSFHDESQNLSKNEGILGPKADFDSKPADLENQKKNDSNKLEEEKFTGKNSWDEDKQHEEAFVKSTNEQKDIRRESIDEKGSPKSDLSESHSKEVSKIDKQLSVASTESPDPSNKESENENIVCESHDESSSSNEIVKTKPDLSEMSSDSQNQQEVKDDQVGHEQGKEADSFIDGKDTSFGKQNSSQIDVKSSIEKDMDEGSAKELNNIVNNTSSEVKDSSHIDEELSDEKEETGDRAPGSFINEICTPNVDTSLESKTNEFKSGSLKVIVHKAKELVNKDTFGKSDPYVIVKYRNKEFRSKTINNTLEPEWNFESEFNIIEIDESPIDIEIYDDDYGKDNLEGTYSLTLDEAINDLVIEGKWFSLENCKAGKIYLSALYLPNDEESQEETKTPKSDEEKDTLPSEKDKDANSDDLLAKSKDKSQQSSEGKDGEYQKETKTSKDDDKGTFSSDKEKEKDASIVDLPANLNDKSLQLIEIKGEKCQKETKTPKNDQDKEPSSSDKEKDENADIVDSPASSNDKNLQSSEVKDMFSIMKGIPQAQIKEDIEEYKEEIKILKDDDKDAITQEKEKLSSDKDKNKDADKIDSSVSSHDKDLQSSEVKDMFSLLKEIPQAHP